MAVATRKSEKKGGRITRDSLWSLEDYAQKRDVFRAEVIEHKKNRSVRLGENLNLIFEDEKTIRYQIQEMLRVEKIFDDASIREELDSYNPLIPDGNNLKATMMLEYPDENERKRKLSELIGIEDRVWVQVEGSSKIYAIADEDLERETEYKTSSVHFVRFEIKAEMRNNLKNGAALNIGVDHPRYRYVVLEVNDNIRNSLVKDLA
ncbi:MAG: hypothetical protein RLZZ502_1834 [Pseudomonadota bacterium]|jgi:hypothetical protein